MKNFALKKTDVLYLVLGLLAVFYFFAIRDPREQYNDYEYYRRVAVNGDDFFYCYWIWPYVWLIDFVFKSYGMLVWNLINLAALVTAARLWKNNLSVIISFQALHFLLFGNLVGYMALGMALVGWGLEKKRWHIVGIGLVLAVIKPTTIFIPVFYLWVSGGANRRELAKALIIPTLVFATSLAIYGIWPIRAVQAVIDSPPRQGDNMTLWQWVGPFVLLVWLPIFLLPLPKMQRFYWICAANAISLPYFTHYDFTMMMVMPIGWPAMLASLIDYVLYPIIWETADLLVVISPTLWYLTLFVKAWRHNHPQPSPVQTE